MSYAWPARQLLRAEARESHRVIAISLMSFVVNARPIAWRKYVKYNALSMTSREREAVGGDHASA